MHPGTFKVTTGMASDPDPSGLWVPGSLARRSLGFGVAALAAGLLCLVFDGWREPTPHPSPPELVISMNTAPGPVVEALPRIGPVMAAAIVKARDEAPFESFEDLRARVARVGPVTAAALRPHVRFNAEPTPEILPRPEP
jgi:hypothetical protein